MYRLTSKLIIYRNIDKNEILFRLADICRRFEAREYRKDNLISEIYEEIHRLIDVATDCGFDGDLWRDYLAYLLASTENPFTLVTEKAGPREGSVNTLARREFLIFKDLADYDFSRLESVLGIDCFSVIRNYEAVVKEERIFNKSVSDKVRELSRLMNGAVTADDLYEVVTDFYKRYGVGMIGLNKAFRISQKEDGDLLEPITTTGDVVLDDLVGCEIQKNQLRENTEAFVNGKPANNVLLYGDAGTGKSTSVKALLNEYYDRGLRVIEVYRHQFKDLQKVIAKIKNRNYRFILFMDDLSFEEFETEYKYLKAVIEGGLEVKPENVLIYATSNRRHLIKEVWDDRADISKDEMHRSDTVQEKLSLSGRFGLLVGFYRPDKKEYNNIVLSLARRHPEITLSDEELILGANRWELKHGGLCGRTAQQYINHVLGTV